MKINETSTIKKRISIIDEIRGLSIALMVIYHLCYDLVFLFNINIPIFFSPIVTFLVDFFAGVFIFISGTCSLFSRNNIKRGIICLSFALAISLITYFIDSTFFDQFGILHMLGISMILFPFLYSLIKKINSLVGMFLFFFVFLIFFNLQYGYLGFKEFSVRLPSFLYQTNFLFPIGLPNSTFASADYFPLIPWILLFLSGSFFGILLKTKKLPRFMYQPHFKSLAYLGRHTMIIYLIHQPIIYSLLYVIFKII